MGTAKGAGKKGNMLFPEGKRFSNSVLIKMARPSILTPEVTKRLTEAIRTV